ncbi:MAG TPA: nucleotide-diphospho-sugar transferase [Mucilaginibacter sp.]|jgi:hypothetical protein|nr:nucleotide-diphospho-sugar transferase [Mucilaginibacter sp.]
MPGSYTSPYYTRSAVLFLIFNRPDTTQTVFEQIKKAKPKRLYIAADGPRAGCPGDIELCSNARNIVNLVDWDCELKTNFSAENAGCRDGVSAAITWFFEHEVEGIILEDDCLPANSFFRFCDTLLEKYRHDDRIRHITGCNLQQGQKWGSGTYYFSNMTHVWGWAGWKRVWKDYDKQLVRFDKEEMTARLRDIFDDPLVVQSYSTIFEEVKAGKINAWGYQLDFVNFFNRGLTIIPNENLISNIGFRPDATHTTDANSIYAGIPVAEIDEIVDPEMMQPEKQAESVILEQIFKARHLKKSDHKWLIKIKRRAGQFLKAAAAVLLFG